MFTTSEKVSGDLSLLGVICQSPRVFFFFFFFFFFWPRLSCVLLGRRPSHAQLGRESQRPGPEAGREVDAALLDADRDYDIKVLILKANGKGFCSDTPSATTRSTTRRSSRPQRSWHTVEAADRPVRQADPEPLGVRQTDDRPGARLLRRRGHPLRPDHRHRHRVGGRLHLLPPSRDSECPRASARSSRGSS